MIQKGGGGKVARMNYRYLLLGGWIARKRQKERERERERESQRRGKLMQILDKNGVTKKASRHHPPNVSIEAKQLVW